jgi:amino acid transporter
VATAQVEEQTLLKAMSWWDGFVVALANPAFLIAGLGGSIGALGTGGAFLLWSISIVLGALQNNIHAELASMFPNKSGGVALYAHEAWRKYTTLVGPLATFGYWIGWSVVLAVNGLVAGTLITAEWFEDNTWASSGAGFDLSLPIVIGIGLIVIVWLFNIYGVRPAVWFGYVTGALLCIPAFALMFLPYITGDWASSNIDFNIGANGGLALALVWLYFMCWSSYGIEVVATFAPEYHDSQRDTRMALRTAALFSGMVYVLLPLGAGGILGTEAIAADATLIAWYTQAFDALVGSFLGGVLIFCVCAGLVLSMNTATMDGSRALYGISKDGMTIREFGKLNRFRVPALAMTVDAVLNILLISFFNNPIEIIAVSNIGYVFATCAALSGFLLLRKDRPNWPRPVHLSSLWVPLGAVLLAANLTFLIVGGFLYSGGFLGIEGYGYGWDKTRWGLLVLVLALFLYWFRHAVQDKTKIKWREEVPATPEEQQAHPELAVAPTTAPV